MDTSLLIWSRALCRHLSTLVMGMWLKNALLNPVQGTEGDGDVLWWGKVGGPLLACGTNRQVLAEAKTQRCLSLSFHSTLQFSFCGGMRYLKSQRFSSGLSPLIYILCKSTPIFFSERLAHLSQRVSLLIYSATTHSGHCAGRRHDPFFLELVHLFTVSASDSPS